MAGEANETARKTLADDKDRREKAGEKLLKGKPTPTQDENDLARLGVPVREKEPDGSDPDPHAGPALERDPRRRAPEYETREIEAQRTPGYQTRVQTPAPHSTTPTKRG
jgi:hypothetical protein